MIKLRKIIRSFLGMKKIISLLIAVVMVSAICIGSAIIAAALPGDINGDGESNNKDVVTLFRYVSGGTKDEDESPYDFNGDGEVNNKDVVALFRAVSEAGTPASTDEIQGSEPSEDVSDPEDSEEISDDGSDTEEPTEESEEISEEISEEVSEGIDEEFEIIPDGKAELSVSRVFGDHMVIQRDQKITVWGTSNMEGAKIRGFFMGDEARGTVKDGKWEIAFAAKSANTTGQTLTVEDSCGSKIEIKDILIGDVWVMGGQSNAKATVSMLKMNLTVDKSVPLRIFMQDENDVINNRTAAKEPCEDTINPARKWKAASKGNAYSFSALGWCIGYRIAQETGIPQGVICTAAGAANIAELMPIEIANQFNYTKGIFVAPAEHYNGLMHPFLKMKFKAMVFFQGEAEGGGNSVPTSSNYARDLEALITELRSRWGFDFPVYNVQLSNYTGEECETYWTHVGEVRSQQYDAYKVMSSMRLIPSYDIGSKSTDPDGAHSPYKQELAARITDLALAELYGIGNAADALAPEPEQITVVSTTDKEKVVEIKFANVGEGLTSLSGTSEASGFVYGKTVHPYTYGNKTATGQIISADTVRVTVSADCKYIGYACMQLTATSDDVLIPQLYNSFNLPPLAFYLELK